MNSSLHSRVVGRGSRATKVTTAAAVSALSLVLAGCGASSSGSKTASAPGVTGTTITFGQTAPHTGPTGEYGQSEYGINAYFSMVNANGGVDGRKLQLISLDDDYNPGTALTDTKKLVFQDHVFAEVGINGSATSNADLTVLEPQNVPVIGPQSGDEFLQPFKKSVYNVWPSYVVEGKTLGDFAVNDLHLNHVVVFYQNDAFGTALLKGVEESAANKVTAAKISYDPSQTDFSTDALKAKNAQGDGVIFLSVPGSTNAMENAMAAVNYKPKLIMSQVSAIPSSSFSASPQEFPGAYIGAFVQPLNPPANALAKQFVDAMNKYEPGKPISVFSGWGWIEAQAAVAGLKNVHGNLTRDSYEAGLDKVKNLQTMGGPISYGAKDHIGLTCEFMVQAENNKFVPVPGGPTCK